MAKQVLTKQNELRLRFHLHSLISILINFNHVYVKIQAFYPFHKSFAVTDTQKTLYRKDTWKRQNSEKWLNSENLVCAKSSNNTVQPLQRISLVKQTLSTFTGCHYFCSNRIATLNGLFIYDIFISSLLYDRVLEMFIILCV